MGLNLQDDSQSLKVGEEEETTSLSGDQSSVPPTQGPIDGNQNAPASGGSVEVIEPEDKEKDRQSVEDYVGPAKTVERDFSIAQEADPMRKQTGPHGTYLDREQRKAAEIARAQVEDREPDLDNPPPIAGTPLHLTEVLEAQTGAKDVPVAVRQEVTVGVNDPSELLPEQFQEYEKNGGEISDEQKENNGMGNLKKDNDE